MLKSFSIGVKDTNSRIARSINIIKRNLDKYRSDELAVCFNGGKDSTVLMFLLFLCYKSKGANLLPKELRVVCVTEEREFEDLRIFRERVSKIRKFAITYLPPPMKKSLNDLVRSDKIRAVFSGQRVGDPGAKNIAEETPSDNGYEPFLRINPILRWSHGDVWDFIKANRVPYCELYRKGYTSLGIPPFSLKNPFLSQGPNRFYPAWDLRLWETERMGRGVPLRDFNGAGNPRVCLVVSKDALPISKTQLEFARQNFRHLIAANLKSGLLPDIVILDRKDFNEAKKDFDLAYFL